MLLSDPGYGNPKTAKVIFLGNEPGAGGKGVEIAIQDRMNFLKGIHKDRISYNFCNLFRYC